MVFGDMINPQYVGYNELTCIVKVHWLGDPAPTCLSCIVSGHLSKKKDLQQEHVRIVW